MLTRLQAFIAHIKLAWQLLFSSHLATIAVISALLESPIYKGAIFSCNKGQIDKDLKVAGNDTLRSEAVEWAGHWYKANNVKATAWETRLAVELAVGELKGYLK